jgi:hypothetical protein
VVSPKKRSPCPLYVSYSNNGLGNSLFLITPTSTNPPLLFSSLCYRSCGEQITAHPARSDFDRKNAIFVGYKS